MSLMYYRIKNIFFSFLLVISAYSYTSAQCGFEIIGGIFNDWIEVSPKPNMADSNSIVIFLGTNLTSVGGATSGGIRYNLMNLATQEEILGVRAIVCPDETCDFNVEFRNVIDPDRTILTTNPELPDAIFNQLTPLFGGAFVTEQFTGGFTSIEWLGTLTPQEEAQVLAIICPGLAPIPTMGEWGFLVLGLLIAVVAIIAIRQRKAIFAFFF